MECLSDEQKDTVITDWKAAKVEECTHWESGQKAMCVTLNTTQDPLLGPIIVLIEPTTHTVLGFGPRL